MAEIDLLNLDPNRRNVQGKMVKKFPQFQPQFAAVDFIVDRDGTWWLSQVCPPPLIVSVSSRRHLFSIFGKTCTVQLRILAYFYPV